VLQVAHFPFFGLELLLYFLQLLLVELFRGVVGVFSRGRRLALFRQSFVHSLSYKQLHLFTLIAHHQLEMGLELVEHLSRFLQAKRKIPLILGLFRAVNCAC
jgi:hypothetical protein